MQSLRSLDDERALSGKVYDAFMKVVEETDILALQEASKFDALMRGNLALLTTPYVN